MLKSIAHRGVLLIFVLLVVACEGKTYEDGVAAYDDKDFVKSLRIWKPLAEQGDVRAQIRIALDLYDLGQKGIPRDRVRGTAWLLKAAEQDHTYAQRVMGVRYEGGLGVSKDYAEAAKWYLKAAKKGEPNAAFQLMLLYAKGQGVPKDMAKALKWSKKTAEGGIDWAPKNVAEIEKYIQERAAKTKPKATRQYYLIDGALACISPAHLTNYMAVLGSGIMADPRDHKCVRSTGKRVPIVLGETVHMGGYEMVQFRNSAGTFTGWTLETNTDS